MPTLTEKIKTLESSAAEAWRVARFWRQASSSLGEHGAERLYLASGLNHIDRKGISWEGMVLSRLPKEHEKLMIKALATEQVNAKEQISDILLKLRTRLISDGLKGIKILAPADYHALTLRAPADFRSNLRDRLITVHRQGRILVAKELGHSKADEYSQGSLGQVMAYSQKQTDDDEFDDLDTLTDVTNSRVANDVQSRIVAAAQRFTLLGLTGAALFGAVQGELNTGSVSYIDRASTGLANRVINIGREDEAQRRRGEWSRVEYSALLDQNVCGPCAAEDGQEADNEADLTPVPNPNCEGGDWCRCFHVFVQD